MEKTMNIAIEETRVKLAEVLMQSNLPSSVISMMIAELLNDVNRQNRLICMKEKADYLKSLEKPKEADNKSSPKDDKEG